MDHSSSIEACHSMPMENEVKNGLLRVTQREPVTEDFQSNGDQSVASFESPILDLSSIAPVDPAQQLRNIMDCILPPRVFEEDNRIWRERASTVPATRMDILSTNEQFELALEQRQAKTFGICPIRRDIYDQLFDELIRQVTVSCAERGLLLLRVRDEIRMSIMSYQSLLESAIAYGLRKAIQSENDQTRDANKVDTQKNRTIDMNLKIEQLKQKLIDQRKSNQEENQLLEQNLREENERLKEANNLLKKQIIDMLRWSDEAKQEEEEE